MPDNREPAKSRVCDPMWVAVEPCPHCGAKKWEEHRPPGGQAIYGDSPSPEERDE